MREYLKKAVPPPAGSDDEVRRVVAEILGAVRAQGDAAVRRYSERLDAWTPTRFRLSAADVDATVAAVSAEDRRQIEYCHRQVADFADQLHQHAGCIGIHQVLPGVGADR